MKLATLTIKDGNAEARPIVAEIDTATGVAWPLTGADDMLSLIRAGDAGLRELSRRETSYRLDQVKLAAPLQRPPRNIMCIGKNYFDHAHEFARSGFDSSTQDVARDAVPAAPIVFTKMPETVIADGEPIAYPHGVSDCLDYEAELAIIIGRGGRGISRADALSHVWGYTIINDVTARDLQGKHKQWFLGKSQDGFCPMGPWIVTSDEIDPTTLRVRCWAGEELRQDASTGSLIFDIPTLIEIISAGITLIPGDVIATGTPAGVGIGFDPPRYLHPGDRVTIEISGIGRLSNLVGA
ncbi:MAG: fumarylacetoacetate hydrolase family protein [Janthinobacterium lividum]